MITDHIFELASFRIDHEPHITVNERSVRPASIEMVFSPAPPAAISGTRMARELILHMRHVSNAELVSSFAIKGRW